jgi:hypothetical protein
MSPRPLLAFSTRTWRQVLVVLTLGLGLWFAFQGQASATARIDVNYSRQQVYSAALRYLRIDLNCEITERDETAAYLLFRYQPVGQSAASFGAIEIIERGSGVTLAVKIPRLPAYHETVVRDGLVRKLAEDYGVNKPKRPAPEPPPAPTPAPSAPPPAPSEDPNLE